MITVKLDGLFAPVLQGGLERELLTSMQAEVRAALQSLMTRRTTDAGFYDLPLKKDMVKSLTAEGARLRALADDLVVLGIGSSSVGGHALTSALASTTDRAVRIHYVDNVDPDTLAALLDRLDPTHTAVAAISKSGATVETLAQLLVLRRWLRVTMGQGEARSRMTFVTDPEKGLLREIAASEGIRAFDIPPSVQGRYSLLTPVGLLPAAYLGIDIGDVLEGARSMLDQVTSEDVLSNPACLLAAGVVLSGRARNRTGVMMMSSTDALRVTVAWFAQLWAESLGKRPARAGSLAPAGSATGGDAYPTLSSFVGVTEQHAHLQLLVEGSPDKAAILVTAQKASRRLPIPDELPAREEVAFLHGKDLGDVLSAGRRAIRAALLEAGVPVLEITLPTVDERSLGGLIMLCEAACAVTGALLGANPFGEPGAELGKRMTLGLLGRPGFEAEIARVGARELPNAREDEVS